MAGNAQKTAGILALQGDFEAHRQAIDRAGGHAIEVRTVADLEQCDGLIIPGGESTTMLKLVDFMELREPLMEFAREKPVFGTGPGTFAIAYQKVKRPESEMARLVHNDYLEQASDSGVPGFVAYAVFIGAALAWSFPRAGGARSAGSDDWQTFAVWLGLLGWALQGFVEFGLYLPALAWPAFTLLGWLLGRKRPVRGLDPATHSGSPPP